MEMYMKKQNLSVTNSKAVLSTPYKNCRYDIGYTREGVVKMFFSFKKGEYKTNKHGQAVITALLKKLDISLNVDFKHEIFFQQQKGGVYSTISFKRLMPCNDYFMTLKKKGGLYSFNRFNY